MFTISTARFELPHHPCTLACACFGYGSVFDLEKLWKCEIWKQNYKFWKTLAIIVHSADKKERLIDVAYLFWIQWCAPIHEKLQSWIFIFLLSSLFYKVLSYRHHYRNFKFLSQNIFKLCVWHKKANA